MAPLEINLIEDANSQGVKLSSVSGHVGKLKGRFYTVSATVNGELISLYEPQVRVTDMVIRLSDESRREYPTRNITITVKREKG